MPTLKFFLNDLIIRQDPLLWLTLIFLVFFLFVLMVTIVYRLMYKRVPAKRLQLPLPLPIPEKAFKRKTTKSISNLEKQPFKGESQQHKKTEGIDYQRLSGEDVVSTKLDLVHAYLEMDEFSRAKEILEDVIQEGNQSQKTEAKSLLKKLK